MAEPAEHYRRAMLDAGALLSSIPVPVTTPPFLVDAAAKKISEASHKLWQARQDAIMLYHQGDVPDSNVEKLPLTSSWTQQEGGG